MWKAQGRKIPPLGFKNHVIASQCSHWRGNPPDIQIFSILNQQLLRSTGGFPHQSAIYYGMIATGNHHYFNSLRGAPLVRNDSSSIWALCLFETAPFSLEIRVKSGRPMAAPTCSFVDSQKIVCDLIRLFEPPSPEGKAWGYGL